LGVNGFAGQFGVSLVSSHCHDDSGGLLRAAAMDDRRNWFS